MMIRPTSPAPIVAGRVARSSRVRPAFTLVEVIVVMVILVIIAGAATVGVTKYLDTAKRQEAKLKMQKIENAAKTYLAVYNEYPTDPSQLVTQSPVVRSIGAELIAIGGQRARECGRSQHRPPSSRHDRTPCANYQAVPQSRCIDKSAI